MAIRYTLKHFYCKLIQSSSHTDVQELGVELVLDTGGLGQNKEIYRWFGTEEIESQVVWDR
jgi:hypothetical protein